MNMPDAVRSVLSNYATFNGRARRSELWWFVLASFIAGAIIGIVDSILGTGGILGGVLGLALVIPQLALNARRLHDIGKSGWWQLIYLIPLVGFIMFIVWGVTDSHGDNQYGPSSKGAGAGTSPYAA